VNEREETNVRQDVVSALQQLAEVVQKESSLGAALASIAESAASAVPGCDAASIAISLEGRPVTAAMTARIALELDMMQYDAHDGPCLSSFRSLDTLRLDIAEHGDAFPHFTRAARLRGVRGVLSVPAMWSNDIVGTLNLYSRTHPFDETAETIALVLAAQVAIAVSRSPEFGAARDVVEHAQRDLDDNAQIGIATGLLMINEACTAEQAERLLQSAATLDEQTIIEIANRIVDQHHRSR
jgi:GAF domain-containing protein